MEKMNGTGGFHIKNLEELNVCDNTTDGIRNKLTCLNIDSNAVTEYLSTPTYLNATTTILVLSGTATLFVNYKYYPLVPNTAVFLSASHMFCINNCSDNLRCRCLMVGKEFMNEMDPTEIIPIRTKYGVRLYNSPAISITPTDLEILTRHIDRIESSVEDTEHYYYKEMLLNNVIGFYLDVSNIIEHNADSRNDGTMTRYESITQTFIDLLTENYRTEHNVDFYSYRLNMTSHYLTMIVKRVTGQSVSDFIFEMLYSQARTLLLQSHLSIQQIAAELNFSDQSSFGKFFKRKSGMSPFEYRRRKF